MELRHLRYFIAVAERENFSRAAEDLKTAQPSLSQQIRHLEREIGVDLFDRSKRKIELTAAGTEFYGEARALVAQLDEAVARAREAARGLRGELRLAYATSAMMSELPAAIRAYRLARPGVRIALSAMGTTGVIDALRAREADAGVFAASPATLRHPDITARRVGSLAMDAVLPSNHTFASRRTIAPASLAGETLITYARQLTEITNLVLDYCRERGVEFARVEEVDRTESLLGLVAAGEGVAIAPRVYASMQFSGVTFVTLSPAPKPLAIVAGRNTSARSRLASDFVETFRQFGE